MEEKIIKKEADAKQLENYDQDRVKTEESEIDLKDLIKILLENKMLIIAVTLITLIMAIIFGIHQKNKETHATSVITFKYPGIEDGKNPDGSRFNKSIIYSPIIIEKALENIGDETLTTEEVRRKVSVEGIIPKSALDMTEQALKSGEEYTYFPSEYRINYNGKNENEVEVLSEIVNEFIQYYENTYNIQQDIPEIISDSIDVDSIDYRDFIEYLAGKVSFIERFILNKKNDNFISSKYGVGFLGILDLTKLYKTNYYSKMNVNVNVNNLTKNKEQLIQGYENRKESQTVEFLKKEAEVNQIREIITSYEPKEATILIPGVSEKGLNINNGGYYGELINRVTNAAVESKNIEENIKYIDKKLNELESIEENIDRENATLEVERLIPIAVLELNKLIEMIKDMSLEYANIYSENSLKVVIPSISMSTTDLKLFIVIGLMLGLFLGMFIAFIKEFFKNLNVNTK